jgi:hypothetical protein
MACLLIEIYWSVGETILSSIGEYLNAILKTSPILIFSPICFYINRVENRNNDRLPKTYLKSSKTYISNFGMFFEGLYCSAHHFQSVFSGAIRPFGKGHIRYLKNGNTSNFLC